MTTKVDIWDAHSKQIIERYQRGATLKDLGRIYGVSARTISSWLIKAGVKHKKGSPWPEEAKDFAEKLWQEGYLEKDIAKLMKTSASNVSRWLHERGYDPQKHIRYAEESVEKVEPEENPRRRPPGAIKHVRGKTWTVNEKNMVMEMIRRGFPPNRIYQVLGANKQRQAQIERESKFGFLF